MDPLENPNYLVIPDTHGEYDKVSRIIDAYDNHVDQFIFLGDVIDGPDSKLTISLIRNLGDKAITIAGNHEWVLRNALEVDSGELATVWRDSLWARYERDVLTSYGIHRSPSWEHNAFSLKEVMGERGDLAWLNSLPAFFETESFVAVHAGPNLQCSWAAQRELLLKIDTPEGRLTQEPEQIFSHTLAKVQDTPSEVDERIFVTGHSHMTSKPQRRRAMGRVCLGSRTRIGEPFFTWESKTDEIKAHTP